MNIVAKKEKPKVRPGASIIPEMTDPLGRYWDQPDRSSILVGKTEAFMSRTTFYLLPEYSGTFPSGTYVGKMWRRAADRGWYLCWYSGPGVYKGRDVMNIAYRKIVLPVLPDVRISDREWAAQDPGKRETT